MSVLVACACVLQVAEALVPHPLPGVRLGLANMITLIALVYLGPGSAIQLAVLRTIVSSMILGTFLTPTFVLSFAGGTVSAAVMVLCYLPARRGGRVRFSLIGISVAGAVSHTMTQVLLVYLLFVRSAGVLWLWPWLALSSVAMGVFTGMIAVQAFNRLQQADGTERARGELPRAGAAIEPHRAAAATGTWLRRVAPQWKVLCVVVLGVAVVVTSRAWLYAAVFMLLVALSLAGSVGAAPLARGLRRLLPLALAAVVLPVLFTSWGRVLAHLGPVRVTSQGVHDGLLFAARIALLFYATTLLAAVTTPDEVALGLGRLLSPLRRLGLKPESIAPALARSWEYFPVLWDRAKEYVGRGAGRSGFWNRLVHLPGDIVADLYLLAEQLALRENPGSGEVR